MQGEQNWSRQRWSRIVPGEHFEHFQIKSTNSYIFCALVPLDGQLRLSGCPKLESHLWRFHPLQPNHHHFWRLSGLHQRRHDHQGCRNQASNIRVGDVNFKDEYEKTDVHVKVYFADGFKKHDSNIALIATNETIEFNDETVMPIGLPEEDFRIERRAADLAMWNDEGVLEEDVKVRESKKGCDFVDKTDDLQHCANMKTCKGSRASMVHTGRGVLLIGILGKDPSCEN